MSFTNFKGIDNIGDTTPSEQIKTNLVYYLDWSFLNIGAYFNVNIPTSGAYGGDEHILHRVKDPYYTTGQVWEGFRGNWIWESGVEQSTQPIKISGVFVNNIFTTSGFSIDYPNGRIIFDSAKSATTQVKLEYSFKYVNIIDGNQIPWFREIQYNSFRPDKSSVNLYGSGEYNNLGNTKVQLPAIALEYVDDRTEPYQLGGGQYLYTNILFHVLAEDGNTAHKLADVIRMQQDKTIFMFDTDLARTSGVYALKMDGSLGSNPKTFPQMVEAQEDGGLRSSKLKFTNTIKQKCNQISQSLFHLPVKVTTETVLLHI